MTRKRFIKLLMAEGFSRNDAHGYAYLINARGKPYAVAYSEVREVCKCKRTFGNFSETWMYIANRLLEGLTAIVETASEALAEFADGLKNIRFWNGG